MASLAPNILKKRTKWLGFALLAALLEVSCGNSPPHPSPPPSAPPTAMKEPASTTAAPQPPTPFHFAVQGGAFAKRANAEALSLQLSGKYKRTTLVTPVEVHGRTLYRVRILVETKADAETLAASLARDDKLSGWIIPLP